MWAISFQILSKKAKACAQRFLFLFFFWSLSQQKVEDRAAEGVSAKKPCVNASVETNTSCFQGFSRYYKKKNKKKRRGKKKPDVEKSVFFFFFKCHSSRDYRPVLWAGSSLVFIIKWPSNRSSSSGSRPSTGGRSRLHASAPSRELPQSLWCIFQRGCDTTAKKTGDLHSSASIVCSEPLQQLL